MSRCVRCDGVRCAECLDLADYRISQQMSGQATRDVAENARVTPLSPPPSRRPAA